MFGYSFFSSLVVAEPFMLFVGVDAMSLDESDGSSHGLGEVHDASVIIG